jgi:hypothetical protein
MANKDEIKFDRLKDKHGRKKFAGTWYKADGTEQQVTVAANHGDHVFTDDEIKALLNDEPVTIKDFKSKSGEVSDITGKLSPKQYMGRDYVGFERVDLQLERRVPSSMQNVVNSPELDNQAEM